MITCQKCKQARYETVRKYIGYNNPISYYMEIIIECPHCGDKKIYQHNANLNEFTQIPE